MKHVSDPERNLEGAASLAPKFGRRRSAAFHCLIAAAFLLGLAFGDSSALAAIGNAWHIPDSTELGSPVRMRFEEFFFGPNGSFDVYNGNQFQGGGNAGDQSGGSVFFKGVSENLAVGSWHSAPLNFYKQSGNNKYWKATINTTGISGSDPILYYLRITYADGHEPTFLYGSDAASNASASEVTAAGSPFSVRNRAAFIFHANNRVVLPGADLNHNDVQFWAKIGHINRDTAETQWTDQAYVYYTVDGSAPAGALGVGTGTTQVAVMHYDHEENDPSPAGNAMWWFGTVANLPNFNIQPANTPIRYKIGVWNSSNNEEKFADYNAGTNGAIFSFNIGTTGDPTLTISTASTGTLSGNYTTTKVYVDEIAGSSVPMTVAFAPGEPNVSAVEIVTNLNQRDQVMVDKNGNAVDDGMEFNQTEGIIGNDSSFYYRSYPVTNLSLGTYTAILSGSKTGAYRLTARWKVDGDPNWRWFTNHAANRRDHAITVSPVDARNINLYEINTLTIEAKDTSGFIERSTFEDLWDAPGAPRTGDGRGFNLDHVEGLGINWLWFQPIHPPAVDGREIDPNTNSPYNPGSPYAVKNFFEINPWMSASYNGTGDVNGATARSQGMASFQGFVGAADAKHIGVMLDAPFNHTGWDAELAAAGVELFQRDGAPTTATTLIRDYDTRFFSKSGDYAQRATTASGDIATAPDRGDFGKWSDVKDVYFGRYDALVNTNPSDNGNYLNEGDRFFYAAPASGTANNPENGNWTSSDFTQGGQSRNVTKQVWKYFARYAVYWLEKTRPAGHNRNSSTEAGLSLSQRYDWDAQGVDGLRADFGQGLPPQLWEYIINQARSYKWTFVAMSESLDGGAVTYRSNRHFDVLNENIVFPFKSAGNTPDYRAIFDGRRGTYGQGLVLLNNTSHDEENYTNIFFPLMRYQVANTVDGAPMVFMGQELGITRTSGFSFYETNFGKQIAHFKKFNSMQPAWLNRLASPFGEKFLFDTFAAPGRARAESPALRSSNRWYLNRLADGQPRNEIWAVAKYEQPNVSVGLQDVVFAFANLRTETGSSDTFNVNISQSGSNLFGIKPDRTYNVRNRAAYVGIGASSNTREDDWLWGSGRSGTDVLTNGIFVELNGVPSNDSGWGTAPYEAQYLKIYDITVPTAPGQPVAMNPYGYTIVGSTTLSWAPPATDPDGLQWTYKITFNFNNQNFVVYTTSTSYTFMVNAGLLSVSVQAINPNEDVDNNPPSSPASPTSIIKVLNAADDEDGDGQNNGAEDFGGTNPLDANSALKVITTTASANNISVTWSTVPNKKYQVKTDSVPGGDYTMDASPVFTANSSSLTHNFSAVSPTYFRVVIVPP